VQNFVNNNTNNGDSLILVPEAVAIEESIGKVFHMLNNIKIENCKNKG